MWFPKGYFHCSVGLQMEYVFLYFKTFSIFMSNMVNICKYDPDKRQLSQSSIVFKNVKGL